MAEAMGLRRGVAVALSISLVLLDVSILRGAAPFSSSWINALTPSARFGDITDSYKAPSEKPLVVLIQDLHFNRGVQANIHQLLRFYRKRLSGAPIAVEGASGPLDFRSLTQRRTDESRRRLASFLADHAEISGAEAYALAEDQPLALTGVEHEKFYRTHVALFRKSYEARRRLLDDVAALRSKLSALQRLLRPNRANADLRAKASLADERLAQIESLLAQRVTLQEARALVEQLPATVALIDALIPALKPTRRLDASAIREAVQASIDFYALALVRNDPLAENTAALLPGRDAVIQIAGGFHTAAMTDYFRKKGISYIVVTPQVTSHTAADEAVYVDRLLGRHTDIERVRRELHLPTTLGLIGGILEPAGAAIVALYDQAEFSARYTVFYFAEPAKRALAALVGFALPGIVATGPGGSLPIGGRTNGQGGIPPLFKQLKERAEAAQRFYNLTVESAIYLRLMADQFLHQNTSTQQLKIRLSPDSQEGNFRLSKDLTAEERRTRLQRYTLEEIASDSENLELGRTFSFLVNLLHGGIGENLGRQQWLSRNRGRSKLGAKGTDLGGWVTVVEDGNAREEFVSDAELQLARNIQQAQTRAVGRIIFQPLVNVDSAPSFEELFERTIFLDDRLRKDGPKRTYRQAARDAGLVLLPGKDAMLYQDNLPGLDRAQGYSADVIPLETDGYMQTGGHGQWGVYFMWRAKGLRQVDDGFNGHFRVFGNGDNANADNYPEVAGFMRRSGIAVMQLNTKATLADRKGGKTGERLDPTADKWVPDQMELAQAKAAGQEDYFVDAGQADGEEQDFNMNGYLMDEDRIGPLLQDLFDTVGEEEFLRIIGPTYIPKGEKKGKNGEGRVPVDGTIGSVMHNINAWFITHEKGPLLLQRHGLQAFLGYVSAPRDGFAPSKAPFDKYAHSYSDAYRIDPISKRILLVPGATPAEVEIDPKAQFGAYWNELQTLVDNFGRMKIKTLRGLYINAKVKMTDAMLVGTVRVDSESRDLIDLRADRYRAQLQQAGVLRSDDSLLLENIHLQFDAKGNLSINRNIVNYTPREVVSYSAVKLAVGLLVVGAATLLNGIVASALVAVFGGGVAAVGLAKLFYLAAALRSDGSPHQGLSLREALARNTPIETFDLTSGALQLPAIQNPLLAGIGLAHVAGHRSFHLRRPFEPVAQLLVDLVVIPAWILHAAVVKWAPASLMVSQNEIRQSDIAKAVGNPIVAQLLSGVATLRNGVAHLSPMPAESGFLTRLKTAVGLNRQENELLRHAYAQLRAAA